MDRIFARLSDEFEDYFRRRGEKGKIFELLVWNTIECSLSDARGAGNFDLKYHQLEPVIKAWEQRNNASFYGDWNWEDLLGKATLTWEEVFAMNNYSVYTNPNWNNNNSAPSFTNHDNNPQNRQRKSNNSTINYNSLPSQLHTYQPIVKSPHNPISNDYPKTNNSNYGGRILGIISLFLLVLVILIKRKNNKNN